MFLLLAKATVLFLAALGALAAAKRSTPALRHVLAFCALTGSLLLPLMALLPASPVWSAGIRLAAIDAASRTMEQAARWPASRILAALGPALWIFGTLALLFRIAAGHWRVARLLRAAEFRAADSIYLSEVTVPIASGLFRAAVIMPRESSAWPQWQFDAAVRHERMHIARGDLRAGFIAELACAVWWFHPLAWWLARRLRDEQEAACDDAVLHAGFPPAAYAEALLAVSQNLSPTKKLLPGCSMSTATNLKTRLTRVLDRRVARNTSRRSLLQSAAALAILAACIGLVSPRGQAQADSVYRVGGGVTAPRVLYKVDPDYTEAAREAKISGAVVLGVIVRPDGKADSISVIRSLDPGLDLNAVKAVQEWRFAPGVRDDQPVAVQATIEINFKLQ